MCRRCSGLYRVVKPTMLHARAVRNAEPRRRRHNAFVVLSALVIAAIAADIYLDEMPNKRALYLCYFGVIVLFACLA